MRYSLYELLCCPQCKGELLLFDVDVCPGQIIISGILICKDCGRWYPISEGIPEMLPDYLRDWEKDLALLTGWADDLPEDITADLKEKTPLFAKAGPAVQDNGIHFKKAEISIKEKIPEEDFFAPGLTAPFNKDDPGYTIELLKRLSFILPLLELQPGSRVLDTGCGYFWTTEWLMKLGYDAVGVDITRSYLDIGLKRMGSGYPHIILADTENLPLKDSSFQAILCYDSFHHIPDRKRAMAHFARLLKEKGKVVLAEPGGEHEHHPYSREVMRKYGILEKGMEIEDIRAYCEGLPFDDPEQHYLFKIQEKKQGKTFLSHWANIRPYVDANVYTLKKKELWRMKEKKSFMFRVKSLMKLLIFKIFVKRQRNAAFKSRG